MYRMSRQMRLVWTGVEVGVFGSEVHLPVDSSVASLAPEQVERAFHRGWLVTRQRVACFNQDGPLLVLVLPTSVCLLVASWQRARTSQVGHIGPTTVFVYEYVSYLFSEITCLKLQTTCTDS